MGSLSDQHFQNVKSSQNLYFLNSEGSKVVSLAAPGSNRWPAVFVAGHELFRPESLACLLADSCPSSDGPSHRSPGRSHRLAEIVHSLSEGPVSVHYRVQAQG